MYKFVALSSVNCSFDILRRFLPYFVKISFLQAISTYSDQTSRSLISDRVIAVSSGLRTD